MIAYSVHETGRREVIGLDIGEIETEAFWVAFLRSLRERGLTACACASPRARGAQERDRQGARLPVAALHGALRQRHAAPLPARPARDGLGRAARDLQRRQPRAGARPRRRGDRAARTAAPKVAELLEAEEDLLAFYRFPAAHWSKLRSTNPLERVNREIGRRSDVVGIFPNDASAIRLAGAVLIEQNDEWLVSRRYLSEESLTALAIPETELSSIADQETEQYQLEGKEHGKGGQRPRRLRTPVTDDHELHHETRLDSG